MPPHSPSRNQTKGDRTGRAHPRQPAMLKRKRGRQHSIVQEAHPADFTVRFDDKTAAVMGGRMMIGVVGPLYNFVSEHPHTSHKLDRPTPPYIPSAARGSRRRHGWAISCFATNGCPAALSPRLSCRRPRASRTGASGAGRRRRCWRPVSLKLCDGGRAQPVSQYQAPSATNHVPFIQNT